MQLRDDLKKRIKVITFDLWDTIIDDDSDEPLRRSRGLLTKSEERFSLILNAIKPFSKITPNELSVSCDVVNAAFSKCWIDNSLTWTVRERIEVLLKGIGCVLPKDHLNRLVEAQGRMEIDIPPNLIFGAQEVIKRLADCYKLCIISDTIITPGSNLRKLLEMHKLKHYFSGFCFSDEVGHSKPHRSMFQSAADQLDARFEEMVHIGDRDHNDIKGAQSLGMRAILFTAKRDVDQNNTSADAVCSSYKELPQVIEHLSG